MLNFRLTHKEHQKICHSSNRRIEDQIESAIAASHSDNEGKCPAGTESESRRMAC